MPERLAKKVLLIGWDAADWQFIEPLMEAGAMPNLRRLTEAGVMGRIGTLSPMLSPMLWNSIATGKRADKHQILGFVEPDGRGGVRPVSSTSRRSKALWNMLSQSGMNSCVVSWYASHPPEPIRGAVVTDHFQLAMNDRAEPVPFDRSCAHPANLVEILEQLRVDPTTIDPNSLLAFVPRAAEVDQNTDPRILAVAKVLGECLSVHNAATYLAETQEWDLLAVYYDAIDHFGHGFMEFHPPKMRHVSDADFEMYKHVMSAAYAFHDMMLGRLLELAGPDTLTILLSDHGFQSGQQRPGLAWDANDPGRKVGLGMNPIAWHRSHGILVMHGPGVKQDQLVHGATLLDIAPTVLTALGLPVGKDFDGRVISHAFNQPPQVQYIDSWEPPHEHDGVLRGDHYDESANDIEMLKQLADLGYIDPITDDKAEMLRKTLIERKNILGMVLFSAGRHEESAVVLREALADRDDPGTRVRLALCLIELDQLDEAQHLLADLPAAAHELPLIKIFNAQVAFARKDYSRAFALFEQAAAEAPMLAETHVYLGQIHMRQNRAAMAEEAFRKAIERDPDSAEGHGGLGAALRSQGKFEDALYHLMHSATLLHHRPMTHLQLGLTLGSLGKIDWAKRALEVAIEQAPHWPLPHRLLAQLYREKLNDPAAAAKHEDIATGLRRDLGLEDQVN